MTTSLAFDDVVYGGFVFFLGCFVNPVQLIFPLTGFVRRNDDGFQAVNFLEFIGFGVGGSGHAAELVVQAEIVLESDGGHGLVLRLNGNTFLGFDGLVQAIAPTTTGHQTAGEFIHDGDFTALVDVMLIQVVKMVGAQCGIQMVNQPNMQWVVQRSTSGQQTHVGENFLRFFVTKFCQVHLM